MVNQTNHEVCFATLPPMEAPDGLLVVGSNNVSNYREQGTARLLVRLPPAPLRQRITSWSRVLVLALVWIPAYLGLGAYLVSLIEDGHFLWATLITLVTASIGALLVAPLWSFLQKGSRPRELAIKDGILTFRTPKLTFKDGKTPLVIGYSLPLHLLQSVSCSGRDTVELRASWKPGFSTSSVVNGVLLSELLPEQGEFLEAQINLALKTNMTRAFVEKGDTGQESKVQTPIRTWTELQGYYHGFQAPFRTRVAIGVCVLLVFALLPSAVGLFLSYSHALAFLSVVGVVFGGFMAFAFSKMDYDSFESFHSSLRSGDQDIQLSCLPGSGQRPYWTIYAVDSAGRKRALRSTSIFEPAGFWFNQCKSEQLQLQEDESRKMKPIAQADPAELD